ncbi:alpha/beta fold hydrolase [Georgenia yuyongxinii]|nr:alpha/beta fold hydrolase [Georgenia yuyongxinii]
MDLATSRDGTRLAVDRYGSGTMTPIVLIGSAGDDRARLAPLARELAASHPTLAYDRRGRGDSGDNARGHEGEVDREIEDLAAVIGVAGGHAVLLGYSSGGILALLAATRDLPVEAVVMFEPPFDADGGTPLALDLSDRIAALAREGRKGDAAALFMTEAIGIEPAMVEQLRRSPGWDRQEAVAGALAYDAAVTAEHGDPSTFAGKVPVPVLTLAGRETWPALAAAARRAAEVLGGEHRVVEGAGHDLVPAAVAPAVVAFLDGLRADSF